MIDTLTAPTQATATFTLAEITAALRFARAKQAAHKYMNKRSGFNPDRFWQLQQAENETYRALCDLTHGNSQRTAWLANWADTEVAG